MKGLDFVISEARGYGTKLVLSWVNNYITMIIHLDIYMGGWFFFFLCFGLGCIFSGT